MSFTGTKIYRCRKCDETGLSFEAVEEDLYKWNGTNIKQVQHNNSLDYYCDKCNFLLTSADPFMMIEQPDSNAAYENKL